MADFAKLFASNFFTRAQVDVLRRLYEATLADVPPSDPTAAIAAAIAAHEGEVDPHPGYLTETEADLLYMAIGASTDPWSHAKLASDFTSTSGTTEVDVTGLAFTPGANKTYQIELRGMWTSSSTSTTLGLALGVTWPTGYVSGALEYRAPSGTSAFTRTASAGSTFSGGTQTAAAASTPYPVLMSGVLTTGATPSGNFKLRIRSGGAATINLLKGSTLSWREIP